MAEVDRDANLRYILSPSEVVKFTLDAVIVARGQVDALPAKSYKNKAVLAVITHQNQSEEGSVFILKNKSTPSSDLRLEVYRVYPIIGSFSISMAQTQRPRGRTDLPPDSSSPLVQSLSEFILSIQPGQDGVEPLVLLTQDIQRLRFLITECKRLKEIADSRDNIVAENYAWLIPYVAKHTPASILSSVPTDLRISTQPIHARLSHASIDMPSENLHDIDTIQNEWVRAKARQEAKAGSKVQVRIRVGTFNVNGKLPSQDLASWVGGHPPLSGGDEKGQFIPPLRRLSTLSLGEIGVDDAAVEELSHLEVNTQKPVTASPMSSTSTLSNINDTPDMLVLGFQEVDLSTEALLYSTGTTREDAWCKAALAGLGDKAILYEKIASKQLVGMLILIIAKKSIKACFSDIKSTAVGAGIMGLMGNKGATAIRLKLTPPATAQTPNPCSTILTFVNAHLAAFDEMVDKRNADFHDLGKRLNFDSGIPAYNAVHTDWGSSDSDPSPSNIYESDLLVWMGDLNYRINLRDADVRSLIASNVGTNNIETLLKYDQLKIALANKKAFEGFSEGQIKHLPTYRFSAGIFTDDLGFDIKRKPAWTDRILHLSSPSLNLHQVSYTSHPEIAMSDHRPVSAEYCLQLEIIDAQKYDSIVHKLYHTLSDFEAGQEAPKIKLESNTVDFGKVSYKQPVSRSLTLTNRGNVPCIFYFVPQESQGIIHPDWLQIEPMAGVLLPQEAATFSLKAYVDNNSASKLNLHSRNIDYTLILHTSLGSDYFIMVTGEYQYTCFANSLALLTRLPGPIRSIPNIESLLPERLTINAPREVMRLVNWMMENAISVDRLFVSSADESLVVTIRECLDTGADFPEASDDATPMALAFGQTLLELLRSWPDPVIPVNIHSKCAQVTSRDEAFELLDELPNGAANVWISVTAFLHFIVQQSSASTSKSNLHKAENLAAIFAPIFMRDDDMSSYPPISPIEKNGFLLYFIS